MTHLGDLLSAYLDDELDPTERRSVETHLVGCDECTSERDDLARVRSWVRDLPVLEAPIPLSARRRPMWTWAAASVAAASLAIGLVLAPAPEPAPGLDALAGQHSARVVVSPGISSVRGIGGAP
jgi:anti-sigma factor RsiW